VGFGSFIGGIGLCAVAVVLAFFGVVVMLGFIELNCDKLCSPFRNRYVSSSTVNVRIRMVFIQVWKATRNIKRPQSINF
jgi:hypothetical protein